MRCIETLPRSGGYFAFCSSRNAATRAASSTALLLALGDLVLGFGQLVLGFGQLLGRALLGGQLVLFEAPGQLGLVALQALAAAG